MDEALFSDPQQWKRLKEEEEAEVKYGMMFSNYTDIRV
jgi:hypothetical protein